MYDLSMNNENKVVTVHTLKPGAYNNNNNNITYFNNESTKWKINDKTMNKMTTMKWKLSILHRIQNIKIFSYLFIIFPDIL